MKDKIIMKQGNTITRLDGRVEWVCEHSVGHTISVPIEHKDCESWWIHGCDGCCSKIKQSKITGANLDEEEKQ